MKKINNKPYLLIIVLTVLLSGCAGISKMKSDADRINFKVTPEVLEAHASEVDLAMEARFPAKYFNPKVTLTATPVLKYEGGETKFDAITVQG